MDSILANLSNLSEKLPAIEDRNGTWTRGDLRRAVQYAHAYFSRVGVGIGHRVAIVTGDDKRVVAALLGARAAGALVCPIDPTDAEGQAARIRPRLVVVSGRVPGVDAVDVGALFVEPGPSPPIARGSGSAWGVATSGSSGAPKTVVLTENSVAHVTAAIQERVRYTAQDRVHGGLPLHHTYGLSQLWLAMATGACLYLPGGQPTQAGLPRWLGGATVLPTIPSKLRFLYELGARPEARLITLAGQGAEPDTRKLFASSRSSATYLYFYGLTEASTRVLWLGHEEFFQRPRATGRPIRGVRAWVDADGELWVEGPNVAAGYLDDPAATAVRFPEGKLRTGDYFEVDGDLFSYLGRVDGIFKRFGEKVIPERVEAAIQSHPDVLKCLVTPEVGPGGEAAPVAWVVGRDGFADGPALIRHARTLLPPVMIPMVVRFVSSLPATSNGKLLRRAPEPSPQLLVNPPIGAKPGRDKIEAWLRDALAEMLAVSAPAIDPNRPLAEYGLDSLGSVDLIAALGQWLGKSVSYSVVWSHPTLAALSEHLAGSPASDARQSSEQALDAQRWSSPILPRSPDASTPVSQFEQRRLQLSRAAPDADGRSVWLGGEADGAFRPDIFTAALSELVMRHDVLRSKFSFSGGRDSKVILPRLPIDVRVHDLTGLPERSRRSSGLSILANEVSQVFDLASAPLLKAALVKLAERRYFFLVVFDHVIADAASVALAWSDLRTIYAAIASGRDPPPRPTLQYIDFTDWHERLLAGPHAERLKEHWAQHLAGSAPPSRRAADEWRGAEGAGERTDTALAPFPCHRAFLDVPDAVSADVRRTAMRHGCTSFVFYYSAFAVLLARASGDSDITISSSYDFRNRERELRDVFGMLTNTCGLRIDLAGVATLSDLLERARREVSRMIAASDLPATLYPATGAFQVLFNYVEVGTQPILSAWDGFSVRALGRAALSPAGYPYRNSHDLLFVLRNNAGRLSGAIIANAAQWSKPDVQEMASAYGTLLRRMTEPGADPAQLLSGRLSHC
ncbi:MAG TPA: condensation domain-containing protein [Casimicrobiaceae bacterium]|nr:condensation domain-containing protein [Casimicrobiaceae bacterium]